MGKNQLLRTAYMRNSGLSAKSILSAFISATSITRKLLSTHQEKPSVTMTYTNVEISYPAV